ncbi:sulfurtransferase TusA family protein [Pedococcus sp. P5_B7]
MTGTPRPPRPPDELEPTPASELVVVDARGLRCPIPVIRLARAAQDSPAGTVVEVWATDPAARADIPAWCRMRAQDYLGEVATEGEHAAYRVRTVG